MLRRIKSFSTSREQREVLLLVLGGLSLAASFFANGRWRPDPVSYTHLDVYKRQDKTSAGLLFA